MLIDLIEYAPGAPDDVRTIADAEYLRIGKRSADRSTCLYVRQSGAKKQTSVAVSHIIALTIAGTRHKLVTPAQSELVRAQEIAMLCRQDFAEHGASAYYDPRSPKFHEYDELESTALQSLSGGRAVLRLPVDAESIRIFSVRHRAKWSNETMTDEVYPISILGTYDISAKMFNAYSVEVRWAETEQTGSIEALQIEKVTDAESRKSVDAQQWLSTLSLDTSQIDRLVELRARFREQFGLGGQGRLVGSVVGSPAPAPKPPATYTVSLAGEDYAAAAVARCNVGEAVTLVHEIGNPHDADAVAVISARDERIGYVPRNNWLRRSVIEDHQRWHAAIGSLPLCAGGYVKVILTVTQDGPPIGTRKWQRGDGVSVAKAPAVPRGTGAGLSRARTPASRGRAPVEAPIWARVAVVVVFVVCVVLAILR